MTKYCFFSSNDNVFFHESKSRSTIPEESEDEPKKKKRRMEGEENPLRIQGCKVVNVNFYNGSAVKHPHSDSNPSASSSSMKNAGRTLEDVVRELDSMTRSVVLEKNCQY